jgi:ankyrin repeat protein
LAAEGDIKDGLALVRAVREGQVEQAKAQLADGVPLDVVDSDDKTALMWAASMGSTELVAMLIQIPTRPTRTAVPR